VGVGVGVLVRVRVAVGVCVAVGVELGMGVDVKVRVIVGVLVGDDVGVALGDRKARMKEWFAALASCKIMRRPSAASRRVVAMTMLSLRLARIQVII
jgi:hypothetical protein